MRFELNELFLKCLQVLEDRLDPKRTKVEDSILIEITLSRIDLFSNCLHGVLEDRLVPESPEVEANLFRNVFKTYTERFLQF